MTLARKTFAAAVAAGLLLASSGIAHADNTNDNSNTNNNSQVGGYLDGSSGTDDTKNWPPTKLDWPPSDITTAGVSDSGKGGDGSSKATPIVMPDGQAPPPKEESDSTSTSTPPTPIVPAGSTSP